MFESNQVSKKNNPFGWLSTGKKSNDNNSTQIPPNAIYSEQVILCSLIIDSNAIKSVIDNLKVEYFFKESHQRIYSSILDLFCHSEPIDIYTVISQLKKRGELELIGGSSYLKELRLIVNSSENIKIHPPILMDRYLRRQLILLSIEIKRKAYDETTKVNDIASKSIDTLMPFHKFKKYFNY